MCQAFYDSNATVSPISPQDIIEVFEEKPDHHYRTEIPNIIFSLGLCPFAFMVYCLLKRVCGDSGQCWHSIPMLAKECNMGESKLKECLKILSEPIFPDGSPLIKIEKRFKPDGSQNSNLIRIVPIWRKNGDHFRGGSPQNPPPGGVGRHKTGGGSPQNYKEELIQEDLKGNDLVPAESLPFKSKTELLPGQKFPLRKEQQEIFEKMKDLNLGCKVEKLVILVRKYWHKGKQYLLDCIHHMQAQIDACIEFKKEKIAFFTHCLNGNQSLISENCLKNMACAQRIQEAFPGFDIKITEKYVQCNKTLVEIATGIEPESFVRAMEKLYDMVR
jgi:hypothetical protein